MGWYLTVIRQYVVFSGRSRRQEYWIFTLISTIISIALSVVDGIAGNPGILQGIYALAVVLPSLGVGIRRLHDTGRSAWWLLIVLIPILGWIALIVFYATDGEPGENRYGPNPKAEVA